VTRLASSLVVVFVLVSSIWAQQTPDSYFTGSQTVWQMPKQGAITSGYRTPRVDEAYLEDSVRLQSLFRDGKIYLSLRDAISLALENNLDLELERYGIRLADTDVLRSDAGLLPRGVPLSVRESPAGLGTPVVGPNGTLGGGDSPTLNSLIGPGVQVDLSILGSVPFPTGPAVPNLDPQIVGNASWGHQSEIQNSTFLPGVRSLNANTIVANVGYQQGFTTGGTLDLFFNNSRLDQINPLSLYNPTLASSVGISFTQPLLRGAGFGANRRYIKIAKNNRRVSDTVFLQQLMATVSGVVRLYWDLQSLNGDVRVRQEAFSSADQFLRDSRNQMEAGTFAEVDVVRAQAELSRRERDLVVARSLVRQQEAVLRDYLTRGRVDEPLTNAPIVPTDPMPEPGAGESLSADELYQKAVRNRPEAAQVKIQLENAMLSLHGSQNGVRPELDVVAVAENSGLAGTVLQQGVAADPLLTGGYGTALTQLAHNNFPTYSVGIQLALPLRNQAARSDVLRDELTVRQQQIRIRQLEKQIRLEVTNASIAVDEARATYNATKNERISQEQTLAAEQQKLEVGASTSFFVIQFQRDLAAARSAEVSALANYQKAKTALQRATGTILDDYQIVLDDAFPGVVQRKSELPPAAR
jgi:outer membrane protein TolC